MKITEETIIVEGKSVIRYIATLSDGKEYEASFVDNGHKEYMKIYRQAAKDAFVDKEKDIQAENLK